MIIAPTTDTASAAPGMDIVDAMVARVHSIGDILSKNATTADAKRLVPQESVDELKKIGAFNISRLQRYGGYEGGARMLMEVARAIGYYCPASAWITVISNGSVMLANRFDYEILDQIFATEEPVLMASMFSSPQGKATRVENGWLVNGKWPFSSNIMSSEWSIGILKTEDNGKESVGFAILPKDQYTTEDTWFTIGMRGTASNTMVIEDQLVSEMQVIPAVRMMGTDFESLADETFGRKITPHLTMSTTIATPALGASERALDFVVDMSHQRGVTNTSYFPQHSSGAFVSGLGKASQQIESSYLLLSKAADAIDRYAEGIEPMPKPVRARHRGSIGHSGTVLAEAINDLCWLHGTAAFSESNMLGRLWRDVNTGVRHASITAPLNYELHGDGLVGIEMISTKL
ncbi:hypothetical protein ACT17S_16380 [Glutamicibacter mysorens]